MQASTSTIAKAILAILAVMTALATASPTDKSPRVLLPGDALESPPLPDPDNSTSHLYRRVDLRSQGIVNGLLPLDTNCKGSSICWWRPRNSFERIANMVRTGLSMNPEHRFYTKQHIACHEKQCLFLANTRCGLNGSQVMDMVALLRGYSGCQTCGSIRFRHGSPGVLNGANYECIYPDYEEGQPYEIGELTINWISKEWACEGLCFRLDSDPREQPIAGGGPEKHWQEYKDGDYNQPCGEYGCGFMDGFHP